MPAGLAGPLAGQRARVARDVADIDGRLRLRHAAHHALAERHDARHAHLRQAGLDAGGRQPHHALGGIGGPQLHDRRVEESRGGLGDAAQHVVDHERLGHELLEVRQLAQTLGAARGIRVDARVVDGERGVLGEQLQRRQVFLAQRPHRPVVHDERAVHASLAAQRRGGDRANAVALPRVLVVQDVRGGDGFAVQNGAAHRAAAERNGSRAGVMIGETARGVQHRQLGGVSVPRYDQRRVRRHDFERALHDRVERLVEVERRRQRSTDGLQRAHERRASMAFGHDGVKADDAHDGARVVTPRHVARGDPATAPLGGKLVSHVTGRRGLAAERACEL